MQRGKNPTDRVIVTQPAVSAQRSRAVGVYDSRKYDHISALLGDLQWLRVPDRIEFRLTVLVHGPL